MILDSGTADEVRILHEGATMLHYVYIACLSISHVRGNTQLPLTF